MLSTEIESIHQLLKNHTDEAYLLNARKLIPSDRVMLGVKVLVVRNLVKQWYQDNKWDFAKALPLIDALIARQIREEVLFAVLLLQKYKKQFDAAIFEQVDQWIELIENWEVCDQLASVAAPVVHQHPDLFERLQQWAGSENFWRRRFVLACGASLNHHGMSHPEQVLSLCTQLAGDSEPMVEKAWHWAVREASKKDPERAYSVLSALKDKVRKSIMKQAAEKLSDWQKDSLLS